MCSRRKATSVTKRNSFGTVYLPSSPQRVIRRSALKHLVDTFFEGSSAKLVAALLGGEAAKLSDEELDHIARLVKDVRSESR